MNDEVKDEFVKSIKSLLIIDDTNSDTNKDIFILFELCKWESWVLSYCRIPKLPKALEYFVYEKTKESFLLNESLKKQNEAYYDKISDDNEESNKEAGEIKSVSMGDTSITYLTQNEALKGNDFGVSNIVSSCENMCTKDEIKLLNRYRRVGWNGY